ncbi:OmpA family protein [bacterium]|nr:OmpA family protein [candidate division CSSED10-310 bacterium]
MRRVMKRWIRSALGIVLAVFQGVMAGAGAAEPVALPELQEPARVNILSLQEGAFPLVTPECYTGWIAECMLDGSPATGWASAEGKTVSNGFVIALGWQTTFESFEFDTASADEAGAGARDVTVEVSGSSASEGFVTVLTASLADATDNQRFDVEQRLPARWVRLTLLNNHGSPNYTELFSFRGIGLRTDLPAPVSVSGNYDSTFSTFHLRQQGSALTGCYEYNRGLLEGTVEGRVMKLTWHESGEPGENIAETDGPAVMVFAEDGRTFQGYWWHAENAGEAPNGAWNGTRTSLEVGGCPHWAGSVGGELRKQLSGDKRARLYGIRFDFNAAAIRPESLPILDEVVALLSSEPAWTLTIEGHTDSIGSDNRNLDLSRQRADAVKAYLQSKGIGGNRLKTEGYGESRPVAENNTELGRAQNRRVELVRN